jgi:hypothetical protein
VPLIVTEVPTGPDVGFRVVIVGTLTVKFTPLLATPPTVTVTLPVVAPPGTGTTMLVALQLVDPAVVPLKEIVLDPGLAPNPVPVIVTEVPTDPEVGFKLAICGVTEKVTPLLAVPPTVTTTFPVVAALGTGTMMLVALQLVGVAAVPLNATVLDPWLAPKFVPVIVTEVATIPDVGFRLVMVGALALTVNVTPLLATPFTVTTTLPVVAPVGTGTTIVVAVQPVAVAAVPLNATVLDPWLAPKFVPVIVTEVPTAPDVGFRVVITGAVALTVNVTPLLAVPPTVTTTLPVVAPVGTDTTMLVALQLVGVPAVPLNLTVLVPWLAPKFVPVIVTGVVTAPEVGFKLVMLGVLPTVKLIALLATPPTVTTTAPVLAPLGTGTMMALALQDVGIPAVPLNVTVLDP